MANEGARFLSELARQGYGARSREKYARHLRRLDGWLGRERAQARPADLVAYLAYLEGQGFSRAYRSRFLVSWRAWWAWYGGPAGRGRDPSEGLVIRVGRAAFTETLLGRPALEGLFAAYQEAYPKHWRGQVLVSLYVYQGLSRPDFYTLTNACLSFREGLLHLPGSARTRPRSLALRVPQALLLSEWSQQQGEQAPWFEGLTHNHLGTLMKQLRRLHPGVKNGRQLRSSRIVAWLQEANLRQVQYWAGHAWVSSTERYRQANLAGLQAEIDSYHPQQGSEED